MVSERERQGRLIISLDDDDDAAAAGEPAACTRDPEPEVVLRGARGQASSEVSVRANPLPSEYAEARRTESPFGSWPTAPGGSGVLRSPSAGLARSAAQSLPGPGQAELLRPVDSTDHCPDAGGTADRGGSRESPAPRASGDRAPPEATQHIGGSSHRDVSHGLGPHEHARRLPVAPSSPIAISDGVEVELAAWGRRAAALLVDSVAVCAIAVPLALVIGAGTASGQAGPAPGSLTTSALLLVVGFAYAPLLLVRKGAFNGQTLGKQALGIRVRRLDGGPISLAQALMREVVMRQLLIGLVGFVVLAPIVNALWPLWDPDRRALHDLGASTIVARDA